MSFGHSERDSRISRTTTLINCSSKMIMDSRGRATSKPPAAPCFGVVKQNQRTLSSQGSGRRLLPSGYFSLESLVLLILLTASLLILPLILPPLPPPPFLLLLLPIGILVVLMILAFMPTNAKDITYTYV